jgi:hypothetical protein
MGCQGSHEKLLVPIFVFGIFENVILSQISVRQWLHIRKNCQLSINNVPQSIQQQILLSASVRGVACSEVNKYTNVIFERWKLSKGSGTLEYVVVYIV